MAEDDDVAIVTAHWFWDKKTLQNVQGGSE